MFTKLYNCVVIMIQLKTIFFLSLKFVKLFVQHVFMFYLGFFVAKSINRALVDSAIIIMLYFYLNEGYKYNVNRNCIL